MDPTHRAKHVRALVTDGQGEWFEQGYTVPELKPYQIRVRSIMTGICRSDIDMATGKFQLLPEHMHGHEGLGEVLAVGSDIDTVDIGDIVATRGEPAFADEYNANNGTFVKVPEAHPRYILEPTACAVNLHVQAQNEILRKTRGNRMAILGTGFMAQAFYAVHMQTCREAGVTSGPVDVIGSHNHKEWREIGIDIVGLQDVSLRKYDILVDLKSTDEFQKIQLYNNPLIILGAQKSTPIVTDFSDWLWSAATIIAPSPRYEKFEFSMTLAREMITKETLHVDHLWTDCYDRDTEWKKAFAEMSDRKPGQLKGYLKWE